MPTCRRLQEELRKRQQEQSRIDAAGVTDKIPEEFGEGEIQEKEEDNLKMEVPETAFIATVA